MIKFLNKATKKNYSSLNLKKYIFPNTNAHILFLGDELQTCGH